MEKNLIDKLTADPSKQKELINALLEDRKAYQEKETTLVSQVEALTREKEELKTKYDKLFKISNNPNEGYFLAPENFHKVLETEEYFKLTERNGQLIIHSSMPDDVFKYYYINPLELADVSQLLPSGILHLFSEIEGDGDILLSMRWEDKNRRRISSVIYSELGIVQEVTFPPEAIYVSVALRIKGSGVFTIKGIHFGRKDVVESIITGNEIVVPQFIDSPSLKPVKKAPLAQSSPKKEIPKPKTPIPETPKKEPTKKEATKEIKPIKEIKQIKEFEISITSPYKEGEFISMGTEAKFTLTSTRDDCKYAFYVYRDNKRILYKNYSPESTLSYTFEEIGKFRIKGFVESMGEKKEVLTDVISVVPRLDAITPLDLPPCTIALSELRIASILDEFSVTSFGLSSALFPLTSVKFHEELKKAKPHFLLVESAWRGSNGSWRFKIGRYSNNDWSEIVSLVKLCHDMGIPTVFWNKEDPVHFNMFIDVVKLFDRVYTTDITVVPDYKAKLGHDRVDALMFAAQPLLHNPIDDIYRQRGSSFAGSYYVNRHDKRREDMDMLFDAAANFPFVIYDRNAELDVENYRFPERFLPFVKGALAYSDINKAYKGFQVALNVNSVTESETMFSRRVFECLACGTPVVSTPSVGVSKQFGDIVYSAHTVAEYKNILARLMDDSDGWAKLSHLGVRKVLTQHTYVHRLAQICKDLNITLTWEEPLVTIIMQIHNRDSAMEAIEVFNKQSYSRKQLWLCASPFDGLDEVSNSLKSSQITIYHSEQASKVPLDMNHNVFVAYFDIENAWYGIHYISDMIMAQKYSQADAILKPAATAGVKELSFARQPLPPSASLIRQSSLSANNLQELLNIISNPPKGGLRPKGFVYSADRYNFSWKKNQKNNEDV